MTARDVLAEACYANDMHVHNDPPLWDEGYDESISKAERDRYYEDADHIIEVLSRAGYAIVPSVLDKG